MGEWPFQTVEELAAPTKAALATGPFGSAIGSKTFRETGVPVIRGCNLTSETGVRLIDNGFVFVDEELAARFARSVARTGDLVFTCWGTTDQVGLIDDRARYDRYIVSNKQMKFRPDEKKILPLFAYYFFCGPEGKAQMADNAIGSSVPGFNLTGLKSIALPVPPLVEQQRIVSLLGALDDKIELNRRMNETLEAMARAIFKDWFVDFGPVRAKAEGRPPPGLSPDIADLFPAALDDDDKPLGWKLGTIGDCFNLTMGQSPPGSTYNDDGDGLPFFQGRTDFGFRYPENRKFCTAPTRIAERDDTLVSVRAPVGDINMAWERCCAGRGIAALRHKSGSRSFSFYSAWAIQLELKQYEHTGTVFGAINKKQFEALRTIEPTQDLIDLFEAYVGPMDERVRANVSETRTLAQLRDLLLPKLMSGEIRLREAEKAVEAVA